MAKIIEVYNYWVDPVSGERKHDRYSRQESRLYIKNRILHLWETSYDMPKTLSIRRHRSSQRESWQRTITLKRGIGTLTAFQVYMQWVGDTIISSTLTGLIENFLETGCMTTLGLIGEKLEEDNYNILGSVLLSWWNASQYVIKRPLVKDHKLALYIPANKIEVDSNVVGL